MIRIFTRLLRDSKGATAIEYGLIAALLGVALIVSFNGFENQMSSTFNVTSSAMSSANAAA